MRRSLAGVWLVTASVWLGTVVAPRAGARGALAVAVIAFGCLCLRPLRAPGLVVLVGALAAASTALRTPSATTLQKLARSAPNCEISARVLEQTSLGTYLAIYRVACEEVSARGPLGTAVVADITADPDAHVVGRGWLVPLDDEAFDRARARAGALVKLEATELEVVRPPAGWFALAARIRRDLVSASKAVDRGPAALLRGLVIGDTSAMDRATSDAFRRAGLSHLVAVSGSNVAIVLGCALVGLRSLGPRTRLAWGLAALTLFVLVVGPDPSVLRAATMGALALASLASGYRVEPLHCLGAAVALLVVLRPPLVHSVGLHLSCAATAGLVLWGNALARRLPLPRPAALGLGATVAAQVAVAPLLAGVFGQLSLVAPLANALVLPAVAPASLLGYVAAALAPVSQPAARIAVTISGPFLRWILAVADRLGSAEWAAIDVDRAAAVVLAVPVALLAFATARRV